MGYWLMEDSMQQYEVFVEERVLMAYLVNAESEEEAMQKVIDYEDINSVDVVETLEVYRDTMHV